MKIGITGAGGMIGSSLCLHYQNEFINCYTSKNVDQYVNHTNYLRSLDAKEDELESFVSESDIIIHLAHSITPIESNISFPDLFGSNIALTQKIISSIKKQSTASNLKDALKRIIYVSSGGTVYGNVAPISQGILETHPMVPTSSYGLEKLTCESLLRLGAERGYYELVILRPSNIYGAPLNVSKKQGIIGVWLSRIKAGLPVDLYGSVNTVRDYLHLNDLVFVISACAENRRSFDDAVSIYNVGSSIGTSIAELIEIIKKVTGKNFEVNAVNDTQEKFSPPVECSELQ